MSETEVETEGFRTSRKSKVDCMLKDCRVEMCRFYLTGHDAGCDYESLRVEGRLLT